MIADEVNKTKSINNSLSKNKHDWKYPENWTGPGAALYRSFDGRSELVLMEGTTQLDYMTLVIGQERSIRVHLFFTFGIHTEPCMTKPETCGASGGAVSLWMKVVDCPGSGGIVSSERMGSAGFRLFCFYENALK